MKKRLYLILALSLAAVAALLLLRRAGVKEDAKLEKQIFSMDTVMLLTAYGQNAGRALDAAEQVINSLDLALDPQKADSALYALNRDGQAAVSPEILRLLEAAQTVCDRSGGALDPAVYPLVLAWGFLDQRYRVPEQAEIDALLAQMDFEGISVSGDIVTLPPDNQVSFGALAKGLASQMAADAMRQAGAKSAIVSLGGNVQTLGLRPDGSRWRVSIQDPLDTGSYAGVLSLGETAAVTSGGYQRFFERDGVRYHHILDPRTGKPSDSGLLSVSIICPDGLMADALSTALFVLGEDAALDYYRTWGGFEAVLITEDRRVVVTPGLAEYFEPHGDTYTYELLER